MAEGDGWSIYLPGIPVAADGATVEEAVEEMIDALRDYAEAWTEHLRVAPNHADNWGLVQIITLASADRLRDWTSAAVVAVESPFTRPRRSVYLAELFAVAVAVPPKFYDAPSLGVVDHH